jgi:hypothetical protein
MDGILLAVRNPDIDPAKLHSLLDAQERILNRAAEESYNRSFAAMQEELPVIPKRGAVKNKAGQIQSRYRLFEDIQKLAMPVVRKHGFSVSYNFDHSGDDILVTAIFRHKDGHKEIYGPMKLPRDESGNKNPTQGTGSSGSFGKRYVIEAALDLDAFEEDDDAQSVHIKYIDDNQRDIILSALDKAGKTAAELCKALKVDTIGEIQAQWFDAVIARINAPKAAA